MEFLIQSKNDMQPNRNLIPLHDFGYLITEAVDFKNWWERKDVHSYILTDTLNLCMVCNHKKSEVVPVGSVEFCIDFYKRVGVTEIKPVNIPECLWEYTRKCWVVSSDEANRIIQSKGDMYVKSADIFKSDKNGLYSRSTKPVTGESELFFVNEPMGELVSEWRLFVYRGQILDLKCYSGDPWTLPSKSYAERIAKTYDNNSYTLDLAIDRTGKTDIVEIHDFFACGLYGFDSHKVLDMMIATHKKILEN